MSGDGGSSWDASVAIRAASCFGSPGWSRQAVARFDDRGLGVAAALQGFGVLYILEHRVAAPIADGRLICLLEP